MNYLPQDIFGLPEKQTNKSNEEVEKMFKIDVKPLDYEIKDDKYDYKLFMTSRQLSEDELKEAIIFVQGLKKINNYFKDKNRQITRDIIELAICLIECKNDKERVKQVCNLINKFSLNILEDTTRIEEIVGLYEFNLLINTYLNK